MKRKGQLTKRHVPFCKICGKVAIARAMCKSCYNKWHRRNILNPRKKNQENEYVRTNPYFLLSVKDYTPKIGKLSLHIKFETRQEFMAWVDENVTNVKTLDAIKNNFVAC